MGVPTGTAGLDVGGLDVAGVDVGGVVNNPWTRPAGTHRPPPPCLTIVRGVIFPSLAYCFSTLGETGPTCLPSTLMNHCIAI